MNFEELIKLNKCHVKKIIRLIVKKDNEDIEQEVYIKALKNINKYEERGNFKSWLCQIAKNLSLDYLKSLQYKTELNSTGDEFVLECVKDKKNSPEKNAIYSERQRIIINAIESLKPKQKEVIMLCEINGYTYEEAAKFLHCPLGTVKSRIYNAKQELAEKLQDLMQ